MKNIWLKIKETCKFFVSTNLGRLALAFVWLMGWLFISSRVDAEWPFWLAMIGAAYLAGFTLVGIVYGWIINPIRDKKRRKERNKKK